MAKRSYWQVIGEISVLVGIGVVALVVLDFTTDIFKTPREKETIIEREAPSTIKPSEFPDYAAIKGENPDAGIRAAVITAGCPDGGCVNDNPATVDFDGINKSFLVKGEFSRAYLYVEALVDYSRPLTVWDDIYFRVNGFGGHLISDDNVLPVPPSESSIYLYELGAISYYPDIKSKEGKINKQTDINIFNLLQDSVVINTTVSVSSDRPGRVMKEVTLYYECFRGSQCSIEEIN